MIRKSVIDDKEQIQHLMWMCFGDRDNREPYKNLEGRYYLYFEHNTLVAMTGITSDSEYGHLEIDWTCTNLDYRHKGYMQALFTEMLKDIHDDIYCSCWRLSDNDKVNLYTLMTMFGFKEVVHSRVHFKVPHNCFRNYEGGCVNCTGIGCECYEDLFLCKLSYQEYI